MPAWGCGTPRLCRAIGAVLGEGHIPRARGPLLGCVLVPTRGSGQGWWAMGDPHWDSSPCPNRAMEKVGQSPSIASMQPR